jgi:tRNA-2-methylthio-N6-dimethylallyladenosine synthase
VRFTTSHPWDFTEKLVDTIAMNDNIMNHVHLPVQSGSDRVLEAMKREYTREAYSRQIDMLRNRIPQCALSTDIIVGFPGETETDFAATCDLMARTRYNSAYIFIYSPRPHTPAIELTDDVVPRAVAQERLERLNELQRSIGAAYLLEKVGTTQPVLVQRVARRGRGLLSGWTEHRETVVFPGSEEMIGEIVSVAIGGLSGFTLHGELAREQRPVDRYRGELNVIAG